MQALFCKRKSYFHSEKRHKKNQKCDVPDAKPISSSSSLSFIIILPWPKVPVYFCKKRSSFSFFYRAWEGAVPETAVPPRVGVLAGARAVEEGGAHCAPMINARVYIDNNVLITFYLRQSRQAIKRWELLLLLRDYFEVMTLKVDLRSRSTRPCLLCSLYLPPIIFFGVGSVTPWPDFSTGWDPLLLNQISLQGGISPIYIEWIIMAFVRVESLTI